MSNTLWSRILGFVASLLLTLTAFLLIIRPSFFHLERTILTAILLLLAVCQAIVQSIFFLHVLSEKKPRWNLIVFASTLSIILVILLFSLWIMHQLNCHMMCHPAS